MSNGADGRFNVWQFVRGLFVSQATQYTAYEIPLDRVTPQPPSNEATADTHYFRLRVSQMWLRNDRQFLTTFEAAVHSVVACAFGDQEVEIANVADTARLGLKGANGGFIGRNFILLPLVPFRGGAVRIAAGLYGVPRQDLAAKFLNVMGDFAKVVVVPQLSALISLAQPVAKGLQSLFTNPDAIRLGYHNVFFGAGETPALQQRCIALIRAKENDVPRLKLFVKDDQLRVDDGSADGQPYEDNDFMLLRLDVRTERDDIGQLSKIEQPMTRAETFLVDENEVEAKKAYIEAVKAALTAPELTAADRKRLPLLLKERYEAAKSTFGAAALNARGPAVSLQAAVLRPSISAEAALNLPELTLEELEV